MNKVPSAVLISDIHFTVPTLQLAYQSLIKAQLKALELKVPLIVCGDTLDSKAIMRAECVNKLIEAFAKHDVPKTYLIVGNHDLINEKSQEHSLVFLADLVQVVHKPTTIYLNGLGFALLCGYRCDPAEISNLLKDEVCPKTLILHQGVESAYMGHYVQDKTSLPPETFEGFRVISGHYHRRQDIKCGKTGLFSYVGNPYTLNFGEAQDGPKGFQVLMSDGSLQFVPTNLRKHVIIDAEFKDGIVEYKTEQLNQDDLIWFKLKGPESELKKVDKKQIGNVLLGHSNFKLDLIPTDSIPTDEEEIKDLPNDESFDTIIDNMAEDNKQKSYIKALWREIL